MLLACIDRSLSNGKVSLAPLHKLLQRGRGAKLNVVELGCGCGIVGLGVSKLLPKAQVYLTDLDEAREVVEHNIHDNVSPDENRVQFEKLEWGLEPPSSIERESFDLILIADCIYNADSAPLLVGTLEKLTRTSPKAVIVMATKVRHSSEAIFFDLMSQAKILQAGHTVMPLPNGEEADVAGAAEHVDIYIFLAAS